MSGYVETVDRNHKLWVYSNKYTGAVLEFRHKPSETYDTENIRETLHQTEDVKGYLEEDVNYNKLQVHYNPDIRDYDIKLKDNKINIRVDEQSLFQVPEFEWDNTYGDINVIIDKDNDVLYFKVGQQIYDELLNLELSNQVNITTNQNVLEFWITKKNQPHILLDTLKLNTKQFLADGQYTFDISDIKTHVNYNELSIFTQRLFSDYKMFYKNQFSAILENQEKFHTIQVAMHEKYSDLAIWQEQVELDYKTNTYSKRYACMSSIKNFAKYDILDDYIQLYCVNKNNTNDLIDVIRIPILEIKNERVYNFWINTNEEVNFLHNHQKILMGIQ